MPEVHEAKVKRTKVAPSKKRANKNDFPSAEEVNPSAGSVSSSSLIMPDDPVWQTKYDEPYADFVTITPEMAAYALAHARANRVLSAPNLGDICRSLKEDDFALSGETIKFDLDGCMFDGSHRLSACVKTGIPFKSLVAYGLPLDATKHVDLGKPRSVGEVLSLLGANYYSQTAAALRMLKVVKQGGVPVKSRSIRTLTQLYFKHPNLIHSVSTCYKALGVSPSVISAMHYIGILLKEPNHSDALAKAFVHGIPTRMDGKCPAIMVRDHYTRRRQGKLPTSRTETLLAVINCFNLMMRGEPSTRVITSNAEVDGLDLKLL
jgi:hypothetical protein